LEPKWLKTRSGLTAVILATDLAQRRCYIGFYISGGEWYPTTWLHDGRWHDELGHPRGIDLIMEKNEATVS